MDSVFSGLISNNSFHYRNYSTREKSGNPNAQAVGKAPTSDAFRDGLMLTEFVSAVFPDKIEQVLDPALLLEEELFFRVMSPSEDQNGLCVTVYDCLVSAIRVALSCCKQEPCQRMVMSRDENGTDIFRPYSSPNPFRGVQICLYPSPDIQHSILYPYPNTQITYL